MTTALTGSPKQIAWAESIREQMTAEITELIQANTGSAVDMLAASMLKKSLEIVETETSAKWFIDKGRHLTDLYDFCSISEPEAYSILDNAARASLVTDEQRERVKTLKDQIAIAKSELDAAIASSKEMQATHAQEYAELKAVSDGWTDERQLAAGEPVKKESNEVKAVDWCVIETCVDIPGAQAFVLSRHGSEGEAHESVNSASQYVDQKPVEQEIFSDSEQWESRETFYGGAA